MKPLDYIGNEFQLYGKEEYVLTSGRASGVKIWHVKNGKGLEMCVNLDRGFDIVSLTHHGVNVSYLTPNGYVSSKYYDDKGLGFLKSFSAGFLTTCGLTQAGSPNNDLGEELPLHGTYSHIPVSNAQYIDEENELVLKGEILDETIFSHKLKLVRTIRVSKEKNSFSIEDEIMNRGDQVTPLEVLYHMNMGYPYLDEDAILRINSTQVEGRNEHASQDIENWMHMHEPQVGFIEKCYYHHFEKRAEVCLFQPKLNKGIEIIFDSHSLPFLTEWKMLGVRDYVLGLEPGNCTPDGRNVGREKGWLKFIKPQEKITYHIDVQTLGDQKDM